MESLVVNGVTELVKGLCSSVTRQISIAWDHKDELRKLKSNLVMIAALTTDAEKKQGESEVLRSLLKDLRDVVYDAENVLDDYSNKAWRRSKTNKIRQSFPAPMFDYKMGEKMNDINKSLDEIFTQMRRYHLHTSTTSDLITGDHNTVQQNRLISSLVDESVLGRDTDKSELLKMLIAPHTYSSASSLNPNQQEKISVISIVGMGGLGKTALARLVYKDDSILRNFEIKAWVCVSYDFNIKKIITKLIESVTDKKCQDFSNESLLIKELQKEMSNKKYLIVLDDVWSEDTQGWDTLRRLLNMGAQGSRVLVTTRSHTVASIVGGITSRYMLQKLPHSICWSIIKIKACSSDGALVTPKMTSIGEEIAGKCGGLPLAANVLGNLMRLQNTENDWLSIRDHSSLGMEDATTKIVSILKLSYDKLPSHLKLCFSYCSLFPKGFEIKRETLIRLWMAEGFLHPSHGMSLEDVGNVIFHSLLANSFFQDVSMNELGDIRTCKMHDMLYDLAKSVNGVHDIKIVNSSTGMESVSEFRRLHLSLDVKDLEASSRVFKEAKKLRSILSFRDDHFGKQSLFLNQGLRIICVLGGEFPNVSRNIFIQSSLSKCVHLRYLDLSYCDFDGGHNISIHQLYNLQTLLLTHCTNVQKILEGIGSLKNLRHLDLSISDVEKLPDSIVHLTYLQTLDLYGCYKLVALPEKIGSLKDLRELKLMCCSELETLPEELGALTKLRYLDMYDTKVEVLPESCINNLCNLEKVRFEDRKFPDEIKNWPKLRILSCGDEEVDGMPRGIETLTSLQVLNYYAARNKETISCAGDGGKGMEELANLNSLEYLKITRLERVRSGIDAGRALLIDKINLGDLFLEWGEISDADKDTEVYDEVLAGLRPHPDLRKLTIRYFPGLKLPKWMGSSYCLPKLVELNLWDCNEIEKLPALGLLPCLRVFYINQIDSVKCFGEEFYYQQQQEERICSTGGTGNATTLSLFPSLVQFTIFQMENLEEWVSPKEIHHNSFPSLEMLRIDGCPKLRSIPNSFSSLKHLSLIQTSINSKALTSIFATGGLTFLTFMCIVDSPELIYIPLGVLLQNITPNLQELVIGDCLKFQGFVEGDALNNKKKDGDGDYFQDCFEEFQGFLEDDALNNRDNKDGDGDEVDFEDLLSFSCPEINSNSNNISNSLHSLELRDCPVLTLLPDLRSFTSLRKLKIYDCDKLKDAIPRDFKKSLAFLEVLEVDFIQREDENLRHRGKGRGLINLMADQKKK